MKYGILNQREGGEACRSEVVDALQQIAAQKLKVFRTFVAVRPERQKPKYTLFTTSKETHLSFGMFETSISLHYFCILLEDMFKQSKATQMLLYKDQQKNEGWTVRMSQEDDTITFDFVPAH
jgi:hypothetical protein